MNHYKLLACCAWSLLTLGLVLRRRTAFHVPLMLSGIMLDVALVVFLEVTRNAINTALEFKLSLLAQTHIAVSSAALCLYPLMIYLGFRIFHGDYQKRPLHKKLGITCYTLRTLGFVFMFWV